MNKYVLFMVMILFLLFLTFVANSLSLSASENLINGIPSDASVSIESIGRLFGTFFKILTFQLEGVPIYFNIFIFAPLTFGVIYMLIDIIKDLIPFT